MRRIGLVVNPVAGMGGRTGLKGTDGKLSEAIQKGAIPRAGERATEALKHVQASDIEFITCAGPMGETALKEAGIASFTIAFNPPQSTSAGDTKAACRMFLEAGVTLIVFCGGDGTARDVYDCTGGRIPVLGIPAGVKMYSAVFSIDPAAAGILIDKAGSLPLRDAEILDIDEEEYRNGSLSTRLYGIAKVPVLGDCIPPAKQVIEERDEDAAKNEIARFIKEIMLPDTIYILGAGTTTECIAGHLGIPKTLLGVDVIKGGQLLAVDADERTLLHLLDDGNPARIIVSPIGAQGFVFGRGTQQISDAVIRKAGSKNVIVIATPAKCTDTPLLHVDSGNPVLDAEFGNSIQVITGYRIARRIKIGN